MSAKIVLTSSGLNTDIGRRVIKKALRDNVQESNRILLITMDKYGLNNVLREACLEIGFHKSNILVYDGTCEFTMAEEVQYIYVGEGNTFELLQMMRNRGIMQAVEQSFRHGACYIGSSAGAMIAGSDVCLALDFDRNQVGVEDFTGLALFSGTVIPHYTKQQFNRYYNTLSDAVKENYSDILSVSNEGAIVIDDDGSIKTVRVKRQQI